METWDRSGGTLQECSFCELTRHPDGLQSDVSVQGALTIHAGWTRVSRPADCAANPYDVRRAGSERGSKTAMLEQVNRTRHRPGIGEDQANEGRRINIQQRVPTKRGREVAIGRWIGGQGLMTNTGPSHGTTISHSAYLS